MAAIFASAAVDGGLGLAHVVDGLARFGAGRLGGGERILGGLIGDDLVGRGALLEGRRVGDRVEQCGGLGRRGGASGTAAVVIVDACVPMLASSTGAGGSRRLLAAGRHGGRRLHLRQRQQRRARTPPARRRAA